MEDKEPGLPPGWRRTIVAGQLVWVKDNGTTATTDYEPLGDDGRRHIVIVQAGDGERPAYDDVQAIATILSHDVPMALVPAVYRNGGHGTVVLVETIDHTLADIWRLVARMVAETNRAREEDGD